MIDREAPVRLARTALPVLASLSFATGVVATLAVAGDTLGYDFRAYHQAITRLIEGDRLYDMSFTESGGFGLFYYPPTFAPLLLPWALVADPYASWSWIALSIVAFLAGVAILPVARSVRWWVLLLAGLSFPFVYGLKLGQVGPILFLTFAVGWRWLDAPGRVGASAAVGAAIKVQPAVLLVWAFLTHRYRAVVVGAAVLAVLALVAAAMAGVGAWTDFLILLRAVSDPITTPHNFTPGAVAYQLGAAPLAATALQGLSTAAVVALVLAAIRWATDEASFLVTVVASQLVSPILWDHYAMLLLLPVAYLLAAGRWWGLAIPLATSLPLVGVTPPIIYPLVFWIALIAVLVVGVKARRGPSPA